MKRHTLLVLTLAFIVTAGFAWADRAEAVDCEGRQPTIFGTPASEDIQGTMAPDVISALGGNDRIVGGLGNDRICGGQGNDVVSGAGGNDRLFGEIGIDRTDAQAGVDFCVAESSVNCESGPRTRLDKDGDGDRDGVLYPNDNCPGNYNPEQIDSDGDGLGDACDPDRDRYGVNDFGAVSAFEVLASRTGSRTQDKDRDGVKNFRDNCPRIFNPGQHDEDEDGRGDACDPDADGDGTKNHRDNCPTTSTRGNKKGKKDSDGDGMGDLCDHDRDGDGVENIPDNCPDTPNADQADSDGDGLGDACDQAEPAPKPEPAPTPGPQ